MNRREFIIGTSGMLLSLSTGRADCKTYSEGGSAMGTKTQGLVAIVSTSSRFEGVRRATELLGINPVRSLDVLLKPNFNSADEFPGSTHNDTLLALIKQLKAMGARSVTIGERCGPGSTSAVMKKKGIYELCEKEHVKVINFEDLPDSEWVKVNPEGCHWREGFYIARPVHDSECIVSTCCLKPHGYGGVFTMSLKLSVGMTHKRNLNELHTSFRSMRRMIAEINQAYKPSLIVMDAIEAFVDGGPAEGQRKRADLIIAGTDRIAIDATGIAILKKLGSNDAIMSRKIFEQEQISRAVELGLGVSRPHDIEFVTDDEVGSKYAEDIKRILLKG